MSSGLMEGGKVTGRLLAFLPEEGPPSPGAEKGLFSPEPPRKVRPGPRLGLRPVKLALDSRPPGL